MLKAREPQEAHLAFDPVNYGLKPACTRLSNGKPRIARSGGETFNGGFTVRKISYGEGVERVFPLYSPAVESITVVRRGRVRRAKLYYLRDRRGKSARIVEKTNYRPKKAKD